MRPYGIIVPSAMEASILIRSISESVEVTVQNKTFYKGFMNSRPVILCLCGIGKANAAHGTTLLIERFNPAFIFMLGVAGAYPAAGLEIGDIAVASKEIYGDEGVLIDSGIKMMDELGLPVAVVGTDCYYNDFPLVIPEEVRDHRHKGTFVTMSGCTGIFNKGIEIGKRFGALCENMEGASMAHICMLNGIPAAEIRGISNIIEDRIGTPLDRSAILEAAEKVQRFFLESFFN